MANRPLSITVIAWFSIVVGALSLASDFITLTGLTTHESIGRAAVPIPIQHAMALTGGAVSLMCGYFLLHGKNWARWLFVIWYTIQHAYGLLVYPISLARIPGIIIFLVFTYFLYRAQASAYFAWTGTPAETQERISARQAFGIFCYFVAGFLLSGTCLVGFAVAPGDGANSGSYDFLAKMAFLCTFSVPSLLLFFDRQGLISGSKLEKGYRNRPHDVCSSRGDIYAHTTTTVNGPRVSEDFITGEIGVF